MHPTIKAPANVDLAGRGILLLPAVFTWPSVWPRSDPPWDPALVYPPPGISVLRRAGLVCGRREGRRVIYARTATGEALCAPEA